MSRFALFLVLALLGSALPFGGPSPVAAASGCTITGTSGDDTLTGTPRRDVICGLAGNDTIFGLGGNDTLRGGSGNDTISGGGGTDVISGGLGDDTLTGGAGGDTLVGEGGVDTLGGGLGNDSLNGGSGADVLGGGDGRDTLSGGLDDDRLSGGLGGDTLNGGADNDHLDGSAGVDRLNGGTGSNVCLWEEQEVRSATCDYDMTAPELSGWTVSANTLDITSEAQTLTVEVDVSDDRDGVDPSGFYFGIFQISSSEWVAAETVERISGDALAGRYRATYRFPTTMRPATYYLAGVSVIDRSQNPTVLWMNEIAARGWQNSVTLVSDTPYESEPPLVLDVAFSRTEFASGDPDRSVTIDVSVADEGVGIPEGAVFLTFFKNADFSDYYYVPAGARVSGDDAAALYRFVFTFPDEAAPGLWTLAGVYVADANRNSVYLLDGDLLARGFDATVLITE